MTAVVVAGGSIAGCAAALALGDLGCDVTVLERDPDPVPASPDEAHARWARPTVPQAAHSHAFTSLGVNLLRDRAAGIYAELVRAGAAEINLGKTAPPSLEGHVPLPEDAELNVLACRRKTYESVLRREVARRPRVAVRGGVTVRGVELTRRGRARVVGVRTGDGRTIPADIVVDATGRRSMSGRWLADAGVPPARDQVHRCRLTGYTRFYRLLADAPPGPLNRGNAAGALWEHFAGFLHPGDNGTFSVSLGVLPDDRALRGLRGGAAFTAAIRLTPLLAPWVDPRVAEPISEVRAMPFPDNVLRGAALPHQQPADGLLRVGDAACVTDPVYGRGVSLALAHAYRLAEVVADRPEVGPEQTRQAALATVALFKPWYDQAVRDSAERVGLWLEAVHGVPRPAPPPDRISAGAVAVAASRDPVVWRRAVRTQMSLSPPGALFEDEDIRRRVLRACADAGGPQRPPGPSREELLSAVAGAGG